MRALFLMMILKCSLSLEKSKLIHEGSCGESCLDIVLFSEAYESERRFESDVRRLVEESVQKRNVGLNFMKDRINVRAYFVKSQSDGTTAFGLHREEEYRSILPSSWSYEKVKGLCKSEGDRCDLPVLLVNTPFYGGLGDEIPIVSSSPTSGRTSFLHEIGHALGDFGEEYDGGSDYSGANFALTKRPCRHNEKSRKNEAGHDVWPCVSWTKHVSPSFTSESSAFVLGEYPWIDLKRPFERSINLDSVELTNGGNANVLKIAFSAARSLDSMWRSDLVLSLNGREIDIPSPRSVPNDLSSYDSKAIENMQHDRHFYDIPPITITENMRHDIVRVKLRAHHDNVLLCHFYVWAYEHVSSNENSIGTFPVFDSKGKVVGFRPTKSNCIMRDMTSSTFCPVCRDAMMRKTLSITSTKTKMMRGQSDVTLSNTNPSSFQLVLASEILLFMFGLNYFFNRLRGKGRQSSILLVICAVFMFAIFVPTILLGTLMSVEESTSSTTIIRGAPPHHPHYNHHRSWVGLESNNDDDDKIKMRCRSTSPSLNSDVVDDLGFRCKRVDLSEDGCCPSSSTQQHSCKACDKADQKNHRCCDEYESCVSCCMESPYSSKNLPHGVAFCNHLEKDKFAFCSCRCRTHSDHLAHQNAYKSPKHFCFGT